MHMLAFCFVRMALNTLGGIRGVSQGHRMLSGLRAHSQRDEAQKIAGCGPGPLARCLHRAALLPEVTDCAGRVRMRGTKDRSSVIK